jgi:hypothetical protein
VATFAAAINKTEPPKIPNKLSYFSWHKLFGILVLTLCAARGLEAAFALAQAASKLTGWPKDIRMMRTKLLRFCFTVEADLELTTTSPGQGIRIRLVLMFGEVDGDVAYGQAKSRSCLICFGAAHACGFPDHFALRRTSVYSTATCANILLESSQSRCGSEACDHGGNGNKVDAVFHKWLPKLKRQLKRGEKRGRRRSRLTFTAARAKQRRRAKRPPQFGVGLADLLALSHLETSKHL